MVPVGGNQPPTSSGSSAVGNIDMQQLLQSQLMQHQLLQLQQAQQQQQQAQQQQQHAQVQQQQQLNQYFQSLAAGQGADIIRQYMATQGLLQPMQQLPALSAAQQQQQQYSEELQRQIAQQVAASVASTSAELSVDTNSVVAAAAQKPSPAFSTVSPKMAGNQEELQAEVAELQHHKNQLSAKLEQTEKAKKDTENAIQAAEKRKERQKHILSEEDDPDEDMEGDSELAQAVPEWQHILTENRKHKAEVEAKAPAHLRIDDGQEPVYFEPSDTPGMEELHERHQKFRPKLISMMKVKKELEQVIQNDYQKEYERAYAEWREKDAAFENDPQRIARENRWRLVFEGTFKELGKQKERPGRVDTRGEYMTVNTDDNETKKKYRAAVLPPFMNVEMGWRTDGFFNNENLVRKNVSDLEKKRISDFETTWSEDEITLFKVKLSSVGKNFANIASYFEDKSVKDCVQCYYLLIKKYNKEYKSMLPKKKRITKTRYKAPVMPTAAELSKVLQSGQETEKPGAPIVPHVRCAKCQQKLDPSVNPGRINTRAFVDTYGQPEKKGTDVQVCGKCYEQEQKLRGTRCPVATCANGAKKQKPTKVLPARWRQLDDRQKAFLHSDLGIPREATKTCHNCNKKILKRLDQVISGELNDDIDQFEADIAQGWQDHEVARLLELVEEMGDDWESIAEQMEGREADECRIQYANTRNKSPVSVEDEENDEDTETRDGGETEVIAEEETQDVPEASVEEEQKEEVVTPEPVETPALTAPVVAAVEPAQPPPVAPLLLPTEPAKIGSITAGTPLRPASVTVLDTVAGPSSSQPPPSAALASTPQLQNMATSSSARGTPQPGTSQYNAQIFNLLGQLKDPEHQRKAYEQFQQGLHNVSLQQQQMQLSAAAAGQFGGIIDQNEAMKVLLLQQQQQQKQKREEELRAAEQLQQLQQAAKAEQMRQIMALAGNPSTAMLMQNLLKMQQGAASSSSPAVSSHHHQDAAVQLEETLRQFNQFLSRYQESRYQDMVSMQQPTGMQLAQQNTAYNMLNQSLNELNNARNRVRTELSSLKKDVADLEKTIAETEQTIIQTQNARDQQNAQMVHVQTNLQQQIPLYQILLQTNPGMHMQMQLQLTQYQEAVKGMQVKIQEYDQKKLIWQSHVETYRTKKEKLMARIQTLQAKLSQAATIPETLNEMSSALMMQSQVAATTTQAAINPSQMMNLLQQYQYQQQQQQMMRNKPQPIVTTAAAVNMHAAMLQQQQLLRQQQEEAAKLAAAKQAAQQQQATAAAASLPQRKDNTAWIENAKVPDRRASMLDRVGKKVIGEELQQQQQQQMLQQQQAQLLQQAQQVHQQPQQQPQQMVSPQQQQQMHQEPIKRKSGVETCCLPQVNTMRHPLQAPLVRRAQSPAKPPAAFPTTRPAGTPISIATSLGMGVNQMMPQQMSPQLPTDQTQFVRGLSFPSKEDLEKAAKQRAEQAARDMAAAQQEREAVAAAATAQSTATSTFLSSLGSFSFLPMQGLSTTAGSATIPPTNASTMGMPAHTQSPVMMTAPSVLTSPVSRVSQPAVPFHRSPVNQEVPTSSSDLEVEVQPRVEPVAVPITNGILGEIEPMSPPEENHTNHSDSPANMGQPLRPQSEEICSFMDDVYFDSSTEPLFQPSRQVPVVEFLNTTIVDISDDEDERMDTNE